MTSFYATQDGDVKNINCSYHIASWHITKIGYKFCGIHLILNICGDEFSRFDATDLLVHVKLCVRDIPWFQYKETLM